MTQKILLIGTTGQVGGAILSEEKFPDFEVIGVDKSEMDVTDNLQVEKIITSVRPDVVINTSAYHVVPKCEEYPIQAMEVNFLAVGDIARLCAKKNITFVTYSTDYVFDGEKGEAYEEMDIPRPLQVYGLSKLAGEYAALHAHPNGTIVIRSSGIFGGKEGSRQKGGNFVLNVLKEAREKEVIEMSSEQIVNPTYAGDLARATLHLLAQKAAPGMYHLASEGHCSWYEFTKEIFRLSGMATKLIPVDREGLSGSMRRPKFSALKNVKAKALGIKLPSWQEGLQSYFKFLHLL